MKLDLPRLSSRDVNVALIAAPQTDYRVVHPDPPNLVRPASTTNLCDPSILWSHVLDRGNCLGFSGEWTALILANLTWTLYLHVSTAGLAGFFSLQVLRRQSWPSGVMYERNSARVDHLLDLYVRDSHKKGLSPRPRTTRPYMPDYVFVVSH